MKLNAVAVASSNIPKTLEFYKILGFQFPDYKDAEDHIETLPAENTTKLMIDSKKLTKELIGEEPRPGNASGFAVQYDTPHEINEIANTLINAGYSMAKEPWDAFWGQRYAVAVDPDGYKIDLYATL